MGKYFSAMPGRRRRGQRLGHGAPAAAMGMAVSLVMTTACSLDIYRDAPASPRTSPAGGERMSGDAPSAVRKGRMAAGTSRRNPRLRPASTLPGGMTPRELGTFSPSAGRLLSCTDTASSIADRTVVHCPPGCRGRSSVYGTRTYTTDSGVCAAAVHDGIVDDTKGGYALLRHRPGQSSYPASVAYDISSASRGAYPSSFEVFSVDGVGTFPLDVSCEADAGTVLARLPEFGVLRCPQPCPASSVYGDGHYTTDSSVCGAAQHAGLATTPFKLRAAGRRSSFPGRWQHGIRSASWNTEWDAVTLVPLTGL